MIIGSQTSGSRPNAPSPAPGDLASRSILVIDDEEPIRRLLAKILNGEGYQVHLAGSAKEALACLTQHRVALLLVDVNLPDLDGISLLQQVFEADSSILGLVMTGCGNIDMAVRAMKAGASDFLTKPFQMDLVRHAVKQLLELHRLRHENTVLKHAMLRSGNIRLTRMPLTDFGSPHQGMSADGDTEYRKGVADGERLASERVAAARRQEQELMAAAIDRLDMSWRQVHQTIEQDIAGLAFGIAHKVLRDAVAERPELVVAQVQAALGHVQERGVVKICVHPMDLPLLEAARQALIDRQDGVLSIKLEADPSIQRGGCLVHTPSRLIDATLETQLLRIGEALRQRTANEAH